MNQAHIFHEFSIGLNDILDGISDGIFILNRHGTFVFVNHVIVDRSGITLEQFQSLTYLELVPLQHRERAQRYFDEALAGKRLPVEEFEYYTSDNTIHVVEIRGRRIVNANGEPLVFVIARNITERKTAEQERIRALQEKAAFLNAMSDGLLVFNRAGMVIEVNTAFTHYTEMPRDELIGKSFEDIIQLFVDAAYHDSARYAFTRAIKGEDVAPIRIAYRHPNKGTTPIYVAISLQRDEQGSVISVIVIIRDISDIDATEQALRQSEERYRLLADNLMIGLFVCDRRTGRFLYINKRLCDMCGYTIEEASRMTIFDVIEPREHPVIISRVEQRLKGEIPPDASYIYTGIRKDGSRIRIEVSSTPFTLNGIPIVQGVARDVSEIESLQAQILHAQKMKAIGTLAGGIAHDFNNILMGIQGNASLLGIELSSDHPLREMVESIQELVKRGASLTSRLLTLAKGAPSERRVENINSIIKESASMFERTHRELVVKLHLHEGLWNATVDRNQIDQVLLNIFVNAWQAMPGGGTLTIRSDNAVFDGSTPSGIAAGRYVKISISDTGIGMDEATRQRIFDPFFSTKEVGQGVGLGLTSAYGIIKGHNGFIDVMSEPGRGSTFTIYLPATTKEVENNQQPLETPIGGNESILVIDDEEAVLTATTRLLTKLGYLVHAANNAEDALKALKADPSRFSCVLLDMVMPGTNVGEVLKHIHALRADIPIVFTSGYRPEESIPSSLRATCRWFLQKPYRAEEISKILRLALDSN